METRNQPVTPVLQPAVEHRTARLFDVEVRDAGEATGGNYMTLTGYASVFDSASLPLYDWMYGEFTERIAPGAFDNALASGRNVHLAYSHDMASAMASTESKTLSLYADEKGLRVVAQLDPTDVDVQRVAPKMKAGIVREMSFAFTVERDQWIVEELADGTTRVQRDILEIGELFEVSVVPQGAYPATEAGVRSKEARSLIEAASASGRLPQKREGKMLSAANRQKAQDAADALSTLLEAADGERARRASQRVLELRVDIESLEALVEMYELGQQFIAAENAPDDAPERAEMQGVLDTLDGLIKIEAAESSDGLPVDEEDEEDVARSRRAGAHPAGGEPVAPGPQPVGEVAHAREVESMRMQVALAEHLATTPKES
jgi:HK97 family phage prohead protease